MAGEWLRKGTVCEVVSRRNVRAGYVGRGLCRTRGAQDYQCRYSWTTAKKGLKPCRVRHLYPDSECGVCVLDGSGTRLARAAARQTRVERLWNVPVNWSGIPARLT